MMTRLAPVGVLALLAAGCSRPNPLYDDEPGRGSRGDGSGSGSGTGSNTQVTTVTVTADGSGTQGQSGGTTTTTATATSSHTTITAGGSTDGDTDFEETGDGPPEFHPCCEESEVPGCDDSMIEGCVCVFDDFCCNPMAEWDAICTVGAAECGANCDFDCCVAREDTAGCSDPEIQQAVCQISGMNSCCAQNWGWECVDEAIGVYGACPGRGGDCCFPHSTPGCANLGLTACVCAFDASCCVGEWYPWCVDIAIQECLHSC